MKFLNFQGVCSSNRFVHPIFLAELKKFPGVLEIVLEFQDIEYILKNSRGYANQFSSSTPYL